MGDLILLIFYILLYFIMNIALFRKQKFMRRSVYIITTTVGALVTPSFCILIIEKIPNITILIIIILLFQISLALIFALSFFGYKITTLISIIGCIYFVLICSCCFGKYYFQNNLVILQDEYLNKILEIRNNNFYSLRIKVLFLQKYYFGIGFKYFFDLPDTSYINSIFIFQFILGKLFDTIIFVNIGNWILHKLKDEIFPKQDHY